MRRYDRNLIISVSTDGTGNLLESKFKSMGIPTEVIQIKFDEFGDVIELSPEDKSKLNNINGNSRLYIIGHCNKGLDVLGNGKGEVISYQQLANIITNNVTQKCLSGLRAILHVCYGSSSSNNQTDDSFAIKFHHYLKQLGIVDIDLLAYTDAAVAVQSPLSKQVYKFSESDIEKNIMDEFRTEIDKLSQKLEDLNNSVYSKVTEKTLWNELSKFRPTVEMLYHSTMSRIKLANHTRPFAKVLFTWDGEKQKNVDSYKEKQWEANTVEVITEIKKDIAKEFEQKRTYQGKLSFLKQSKDKCTDLQSKEILDEIIHQTLLFTR